MPRVPGRPGSRKRSVNRHGQLDPPPYCPYLKKTIRLLSTLGNILSLRSKGDAIYGGCHGKHARASLCGVDRLER